MASLSFEVLWKDRGVANGLKGLGAGADQAHGKMSKFSTGAGKGLSKVGGLVKGFGIAGVAAFAAAGAAGVAMGAKVASGNEQAKISFTTMLGSAKKADGFLRDLQKFAAETPFEFPELQTAASSLISAGINADKVIPIMRTLGDVTSGMGTGSEGVQRATIALQQMAAAGRITGEDLNQLRDAGIPVYDLLASATGKSKEEVVKLAQAGKLGKKELGQMMEALENGKGLERFNGLMEKQSKSLAGTFSTLKDTVGQGLGEVMANALPMMKQGIGGISAMATSAFGWVDKNKGSISSLFSTAGATLSAFGRIASGVFSSFISSTGDGTSSFKSFASFISTNQESIVRGFVSAGKGALAFGRTMASASSAGLRGFAFLLDGVTTATSGILAAVGSMAAGSAAAFGWIPGIGPKLKGAVTAFNNFSKNAVDGSRKAADGARGLADGIDKKVIPSIDKGAAALDKFGNKEIVKARQRDQVAKFTQALLTIPKEKRAEIRAIAKTKGVGVAMKELKKVKDKEAKIKVSSNAKKAAAEANKESNKTKDRRRDIKFDTNAKKTKDLADRETNKAKNRQRRIDVDTNARKTSNTADRETGRTKNRTRNIDVNTNARSTASAAQRAINSVHGKTVTITTRRRTIITGKSTGGGETDRAFGGKIDSGSRTPRADDVPVMSSYGEWFIQKPAVDKYGDAAMAAVNAGTARILFDGASGRAYGGPVGRAYGGPVRGDLVMAGSARGGGTLVQNFYFEKYLGNKAELRSAIVEMSRHGQLDVVNRTSR